MSKRLHNLIMSKAGSPAAERWLAAFGVAESSVFPVPVDIMLAPVALARPHRAWYLASNVILATTLGAMIGYLIGWLFMESAGTAIIDLYGYQTAWQDFQDLFETHGLLILLFVGYTPIPYKLAAIASGALALDPLFFLGATLLAKAPRYSLQIWLLVRFGEPVRSFTEKHLGIVLTLVAIITVLAIAPLF